MGKSSDLEYKTIAARVYDVDSSKEKNPIKTGDVVGGGKFLVLKRWIIPLTMVCKPWQLHS